VKGDFDFIDFQFSQGSWERKGVISSLELDYKVFKKTNNKKYELRLDVLQQKEYDSRRS
jgi:hypothetical protein